jgi:hypothetical protein
MINRSAAMALFVPLIFVLLLATGKRTNYAFDNSTSTSLTDLITGPYYRHYISLARLCCIYVGGQANPDELSTSRHAIPGPSLPKGYDEPPEVPPASTGGKNMAILF